MDYWNSILTEKSWNILQHIKKKLGFILIGGWAVYLWTKAQKSKDIDIIIDYNELNKLRNEYDLKKNDNLKKYEIQIEEIDIDIYVPYFSELAIPVEDILDNTTTLQGFRVVIPEILLILKQSAELDRKETLKGKKDVLDILTLMLNSGVDFKRYNTLLKKYRKESYRQRLISIIRNFREINLLYLNPREWKLKKEEFLKKI